MFLHLLICLVAALLAFGCVSPPATRAPTHHHQNEEAATARVRGRILGITPTSGADAHAQSVRLTLANEDGITWTVTLAPGWYLEKNGLVFRQEDMVQVVPVQTREEEARAEAATQHSVTAESIDVNGVHLILRDAEGRPKWETKNEQ